MEYLERTEVANVDYRWRLREVGEFLTRQILRQPPLSSSDHYNADHFASADPEPKPAPEPVPDIEGRDL